MLMPVSGLYCSYRWYTAGESVCMYARTHAYGRACQVVGPKLAVWLAGRMRRAYTLDTHDQ